MERFKDIMLGLGLLFAIAISLWAVWFEALPLITSDFWRGFAVLGFSLLTPLYLLSFGVVFYFGLLGKGT